MPTNFDIEPLGGYAPQILSGLGEGFKRSRIQREQEEATKQASEAKRAEMMDIMDSVKSRDPEKLAEAMLKYPDAQAQILTAKGQLSEPAMAAEKDIYTRAMSNPDTALQTLEQGLQQLQQAGADQQTMSGVLADMDALSAGDPKGMENIRLKVAGEYPDIYKAWSEQQKKSNAEFIKGQDDTSAMQDFKYYQKLKKDDPLAAESFGKERGYISREGEELSSHLQKRLSVASDEAVSSENNSRSYDDLAAQVEESKMGAGLFGSKWKESFKEVAGTQDAVTELRKKYNAIRASQAVKNLPPGPASDKDIQLALSGFPSENANKQTIASFLRGMSKLEGERAKFANFKASYISEEGTERGMLKAWKDRGGEVAEEQQSVSAPQYQDGQTATNPQTGKKVIFTNGQWQPAS